MKRGWGRVEWWEKAFLSSSSSEVTCLWPHHIHPEGLGSRFLQPTQKGAGLPSSCSAGSGSHALQSTSPAGQAVWKQAGPGLPAASQELTVPGVPYYAAAGASLPPAENSRRARGPGCSRRAGPTCLGPAPSRASQVARGGEEPHQRQPAASELLAGTGSREQGAGWTRGQARRARRRW